MPEHAFLLAEEESEKFLCIGKVRVRGGTLPFVAPSLRMLCVDVGDVPSSMVKHVLGLSSLSRTGLRCSHAVPPYRTAIESARSVTVPAYRLMQERGFRPVWAASESAFSESIASNEPALSESIASNEPAFSELASRETALSEPASRETALSEPASRETALSELASRETASREPASRALLAVEEDARTVDEFLAQAGRSGVVKLRGCEDARRFAVASDFDFGSDPEDDLDLIRHGKVKMCEDRRQVPVSDKDVRVANGVRSVCLACLRCLNVQLERLLAPYSTVIVWATGTIGVGKWETRSFFFASRTLGAVHNHPASLSDLVRSSVLGLGEMPLQKRVVCKGKGETKFLVPHSLRWYSVIVKGRKTMRVHDLDADPYEERNVSGRPSMLAVREKASDPFLPNEVEEWIGEQARERVREGTVFVPIGERERWDEWAPRPSPSKVTRADLLRMAESGESLLCGKEERRLVDVDEEGRVCVGSAVVVEFGFVHRVVRRRGRS